MPAPRIFALVVALGAGDAGVTEAAARALWRLAAHENDANRVAIVKAGAIGPLVELLSLGSDNAKEQAAGALRNLSINAANRAAIAAAGAIAPLVELLRRGSASAKESAVGALLHLANNDANAAAIVAAGGIAPLEQLARDGEGHAQSWASKALDKVRAARSEHLKAERERAGVDEYMPERPKEHVCPISLNMMIDPVAASDGMTYERAKIEKWLLGSSKSPITGAELPHSIVVPVQALKIIIRDWEEQEHKKCMAIARERDAAMACVTKAVAEAEPRRKKAKSA